MSNWLQRIADRLAPAPEGKSGSHIAEHFYKRSLYKGTGEFLEALLAFFPDGVALQDSDLQVLIRELRGQWGPEKALEEGDLSDHVAFWKTLAARSSSPYAMACHADTLLLAGREAEAISVFLLVLEREPELLDELGEEIGEHAKRIGGKDWLQFQLASLRVAIGGLADQDSDAVRERYSELLEEYSDDMDAIEEIRVLGKSLEAAVKQGHMPRGMVIRHPSRSSN